MSYNLEAVGSPDFEPTHAKTQRIHGARLNELIGLGIYELILKHGDPHQIGGDGINIDSRFRGDPKARVKVSRSKQGEGVLYREVIEVTYDGTTLSIDGAHHIYSGQIPLGDTIREEVLGEALDDAFSNPSRTIITDFDPRKFY